VALPASPAQAGAYGEVISIQNADGRWEYFRLDGGRHLLYRWQTSPGSSTLTSWVTLGGILSGGLAAIRNENGTPGVFGRAEGGWLAYIQQITAGGSWGGWISFGGAIAAWSAVDADTWRLCDDGTCRAGSTTSRSSVSTRTTTTSTSTA
jgi:hypothetical protein